MPFDFTAIRFWEMPEVTGIGRLPMRTPLIPFADVEAARTGDRDASPWFHLLDGRWRFHLAAGPDDVPADACAPDLDDSTWAEVDVPGLWTMQGFDRPQYTNVEMPFPGPPPVPPSENPTGCYRTRFSLPEAWEGRRTILSVGSAESALAVAVNGHLVGISKDSRLAAEFDLTSFLEAGENVLAFIVVKWSDATWIEDQDQWWHGGLPREVFLWSRVARVRVVRTAESWKLLGDGSVEVARVTTPSCSRF